MVGQGGFLLGTSAANPARRGPQRGLCTHDCYYLGASCALAFGLRLRYCAYAMNPLG